MIVTFNPVGFITALILFIWAQVVKYIAKKFNISFISTYLPLIILVISYIIYLIVLKSFIDPIFNAIGCTALCCYSYDLYKSIKLLIQSIISKIRTSKTSE